MKSKRVFLAVLVFIFAALAGQAQAQSSNSNSNGNSNSNSGRRTERPERQRPPQTKVKVLAPDLLIMKASQTEPDFWIIRVKNAGDADAAACNMRVQMMIPQSSGGFPGGVVEQFTVSVPAVKANGVTDVNVKTKLKTKPGMTAHFEVNYDKVVKELHYDNNSTTAEANPSYK